LRNEERLRQSREVDPDDGAIDDPITVNVRLR
jgi:hypothetical protein